MTKSAQEKRLELGKQVDGNSFNPDARILFTNGFDHGYALREQELRERLANKVQHAIDQGERTTDWEDVEHWFKQSGSEGA